MDEPADNDISPTKKAKEIAVIEVEHENYHVYESERVVRRVRRNYQVLINSFQLCKN